MHSLAREPTSGVVTFFAISPSVSFPFPLSLDLYFPFLSLSLVHAHAPFFLLPFFYTRLELSLVNTETNHAYALHHENRLQALKVAHRTLKFISLAIVSFQVSAFTGRWDMVINGIKKFQN